MSWFFCHQPEVESGKEEVARKFSESHYPELSKFRKWLNLIIFSDQHLPIEIVVNSRRRMHLCMQDNQNGQKTMVLTSAEETRLTCFILLQNIFFWSNQPSLTADVNTIINLPWYPRKIVHFSLVLSPSRVYYDFYGEACQEPIL